MVRLSIPAQLHFRDLALSAVLAALDAGGDGPGQEVRDEIISALNEAFNNVVLHAYRGVQGGRLDLAIATSEGEIEIQMSDRGRSFDPGRVARLATVTAEDPASIDVAELPESGMGLFIIRSFMDDVSYTRGGAGQPNVLVLRKRWRPAASAVEPRKETSQSGWRMRSVAVHSDASAVRTAGSLKRK